MKVKVYAAIALMVLVVTSIGLAVDTPPARKKASGLVGMLPASDVVAVVDTKRILNDALPRVLAANQPMLAKITGTMDSFQTRTGIDPRKFDQVVFGLKAKPSAAGKAKFEAVAVARGDFSSATLITAVKTASENKFREEKLGERTIYVISIKDVAAKVNDPKHRSMIEHFGESGELALAAIDANTVTFGSLARVRETLQGGTAVNADILALLPTTGSPIVSFAGYMQEGMANLLPLNKDELGMNLAAIRYVAGTMDVAEGSASVHMMARTAKPDQAQSLLTQIQGLQTIGKAILGNSPRADRQVYARMAENAKLARQGNDVTLDLQVPQSDIDILVGKK
ncbi:MAG TPA: hypothetical protein VHL50_01220 [Pyrinomonadaceae bacterium]|nr:hypothetical protein [Pyrinomonadaceae bacterium]